MSALQQTTRLNWANIIVSHVGTTEINLNLLFTPHNSERPRYVFTKRQGFSLSLARNSGAQQADTEFVFFFDIDLVGTTEFWQRLHQTLTMDSFQNDKHSFLVLPVTYAPPVFELRGDAVSDELINRLESKVTKPPVPFSSALVIKRSNFVELGGFLQEYKSWGFEDFEFALWMIFARFKWPKPTWEEVDLGFDSFFESHHVGFRSALKLLSATAESLELRLLHIWHPTPTWKTAEGVRDNGKLLRKQFRTGYSIPRPLREAVEDSGVLVVGSQTDRPWSGIRPQIQQFGTHEIFVAQRDLEPMDVKSLKRLVRDDGIGYILAHNLTAQHRQFISAIAGKAEVRAISFERGCLPDSWFFSRQNGSVPDVHRADFLDKKEPTSSALEEALVVQKSLKEGGNYLEQQPRDSSKPPATLDTDRGLVLFLLQKPNDATIVTNGGPFKDYGVFFDMLADLIPDLISSGKRVAVKTHPLAPKIPQWLDQFRIDIPIESACRAAERVVSVNSGSTIYAIVEGKPTILLGRGSPSAGAGIGAEFNEAPAESHRQYIQRLKTFILECQAPNPDLVTKRIANLLELYSFANSESSVAGDEDSGFDRITHAWNFRQLVFDGKCVYKYEAASEWTISDFGGVTGVERDLSNLLRLLRLDIRRTRQTIAMRIKAFLPSGSE